jgi:uncharacterized membrane protein YebE (DUF533 family)
MNLGSIIDGLMRSQGSPSGRRPQQGGLGGLGGMLGGTGAAGGFGSRIPGGMGGLAAGSLLSLILGSRGGRSAGGSLMKAGGLAVLASVAFKAYQDWQANQAPGASRPGSVPAQPPAGSGFHLEEEKDKNGHEMGLALVQAMISAAKSDGHLDGEESTRIQEQIQQLGLGNEEKGFLLDMMGKPADAAAIARLPKTKEQAAELYVASRVAIGDADTPEEKAYLDRLVALLDLPADLVTHLDAQIGAVRQTVATGTGA